MAAVTQYTYLDCFAELLNRVPMLGTIYTADAAGIAVRSITDLSVFGGTRMGIGDFNDRYVYRFNLIGNDRKKQLGDLASPNTGVVSVATAVDYSDTTDLDYALLGIDPDIIMGWFIEGQRRQRFIQDRALVQGHDGDMELTGVSYWDGSLGGSAVLNVTPLKITSDVYSGTQALQVTTSNTSNVIDGERIRVTPGSTIYSGAIIRATTLGGTLTYGWRDVTNSAFMGPQQVISGIAGGDWYYVQITATVPATCNLIQPSFYTNHSGDVYLIDTMFGPYESGRMRYPLPDGVDESYELPAVRMSRFWQGSPTNNYFAAQSREWVRDLRPQLRGTKEDFFTEVNRRDVNPCNIQFRSHVRLSSYPMWLATAPQVSDFEPLDSETGTTKQPLDLVVSHAIVVMAEQMGDTYASDPRWPKVLAEAQRRIEAEVLMRPPEALEEGYMRYGIGQPWRGRRVGGYGGAGGWT